MMPLSAEWAGVISMVLFVFLGVLVWRVPRDRIYRQAPSQAPWRDLRLWATLIIIIQLTIYTLFT